MTDTPDLAAQKRKRLALVLDVAERVALTALYLSLVERLVRNYLHTHNLADLLMLASETLVVVLALIRRTPQQITFRLQDWVLALGASALPLMLSPVEIGVQIAPGGSVPTVVALATQVHALGPAWVGLTLQSIALGGQLFAKTFLFRNFGVAPALRGVAVHGPYAIVRHPMYAAYFFGMAGFLYAFPTWWNAGIIAVWTVMQVYRIHAEERVLVTAPSYRDYAARVRWRLIPGVY